MENSNTQQYQSGSVDTNQANDITADTNRFNQDKL